jgi:hypothetical protein
LSKGAGTDRPSLYSGPYYYLARATRLPQNHRHDFHDRDDDPRRPGPEDLRKFFRALRRAQLDLDLRPDRYTHYYKNEFPERFHAQMDTRRWGPGERLVFEPYTKEAHAETFDWITRHGIFAEGGIGHGRYEDSVMSLSAAG